ncbi:MAG: hypothetical protein WCG16_14810, partial [Methylococcales bacterium]
MRHATNFSRYRLIAFTLVLYGMLLAGPVKATLVDGPDGGVNATVIGADGTAYVGGDFTRWGPQTGGGAALATSNGLVNRSFPKILGTVYASVPDGAGGFYIGGSFTKVGGLARNNLAQIDVNGTVTTWNPNPNDSVNALALSGSTVYAGGNFSTLCTAPSSCNSQVAASRNYVAAIGTDGNLSTTWNPSANGTVNALAISGSTVYAGGYFSTLCTAPSSCNGQVEATRNYLAAIDTNGSLSTTWNPNANSIVYALTISGSTVYAGGDFTTLCTAPSSCNRQVEATRNSLAAIDTNGSLSTTWNPNANSTVLALTISGSTVYAGGTFTTLCTAPSSCNRQVDATRNYLAAIDTNGSLSTTWNPNASDIVSALTISGSTVYAGGNFTTLCTAPSSCNGQVAASRNYLAAIDTNGSLSTTWN